MSHFCYLCLAERLATPDPVYGPYIIRCPLQLDRETGALLFPGNITTGARVRMALRSTERTSEGAVAAARRLASRRPGQRPALVLQFECCCRASLLFGSRTTPCLIAPLQRAFPGVPWFGFNTYGEIAPIAPQTPVQFHNYSTVLCALYDASVDG